MAILEYKPGTRVRVRSTDEEGVVTRYSMIADYVFVRWDLTKTESEYCIHLLDVIGYTRDP